MRQATTVKVSLNAATAARSSASAPLDGWFERMVHAAFPVVENAQEGDPGRTITGNPSPTEQVDQVDVVDAFLVNT